MRLFIAITPPEEVRDRLAGLCTGLADIRWVAAENMHITLAFLGEVDGSRAADVDAALAAIEQPAFPLRVCGLDIFAARRRVRVIYAAIAPSDALLHLHKGVLSALAPLEIGEPERKRKFKPHITLARPGRALARLENWLHERAGFTTPPFMAERFTLYESILGTGGAHYRPLRHYDLCSR